MNYLCEREPRNGLPEKNVFEMLRRRHELHDHHDHHKNCGGLCGALDSFVESFPPRDRPFMRQFAETQMFSVYTDAVLR